MSAETANSSAALALSVVIPVYNSAGSIGLLTQRLHEVLPSITTTFEVILVEDGSPDASWGAIEAALPRYPWLRAIRLMRNYGQHNALLCGIRAARYEVIVTMDDDLQHPPEKIPVLLHELQQGYDVVYGSPQRETHSLFRNLASQVTKAVLQGAMGAETASSISAFRAFRTALRQGFAVYSGPYVNIDVLLTWATKRFTAVRVDHAPRAVGQSNYTFGKLVTHTFNMVTGFSALPLKLASTLGFLLTLFGAALLFYVIVIRIIIFGYEVPGFTFLASIIAIFAGAQMFTLGIIGEYLARMHFRLMDKPPYVVGQDRAGGTPTSTTVQAASMQTPEETQR